MDAPIGLLLQSCKNRFFRSVLVEKPELLGGGMGYYVPNYSPEALFITEAGIVRLIS